MRLNWKTFFLPQFGKLRQNFSEVADFVTVYIAEVGHSNSWVWPTGSLKLVGKLIITASPSWYNCYHYLDDHDYLLFFFQHLFWIINLQYKKNCAKYTYTQIELNWLSLIQSVTSDNLNCQAHPAERGHFKVGGEGGNYDIDTHANIADRFISRWRWSWWWRWWWWW